MRVFSEAMNKYAGDHDNGKLTDIISILMHRKSWEGLELNRSMWFPSILGTAGSEHGRTLFKLSSRGSESSQISRCTRRGCAMSHCVPVATCFFTRRAIGLTSSCRANFRDSAGCTRAMKIVALRCWIESVGDWLQLHDASCSRSVRPECRSAVSERRSSVSRIWGFILYVRP